jgi:hypothetical protein
MLAALRVFCLASLALAAAEVGPKRGKKNRKLSVSSAASGEEIASGEGFSFSVERFAVDGTLPSAQSEWKAGPGEHANCWGKSNLYWPVSRGGTEGVVWWCTSSNAVKVTWMAADDVKTQTLIQPEGGGKLTWAASNDEVIVLWVDWPNPQKDHCKEGCSDKPARLVMYRFDATSGNKLQEKDMTTTFRGLSKAGVHKMQGGFGGGYAKYNKATGKILASFRFLMLRAKDGFNHQGCQTWEINPSNLDGSQLRGLYNSHCFDNSILVNPSGSAEIATLGDAYCRGIKHVHYGKSSMLLQMNATAGEITSQRLVLDPPDEMESALGGPLPNDGDEEAPVQDTVFGNCQHSHQCDYRGAFKKHQKGYQALYMEIGHPLFGKTADGQLFSVFGAEETPPGLCAEQENAFKPHDPRNLIFKTQAGGEKGERLLTDFKTLEDGSVSRIKQATLEPGRHVLMYEVWKSKIYDRTVLMIVDDTGDTLAGPWTLDLPHRILAHQDELNMINGKLVYYDGSGSEIQRYTLTYSESTCEQTTDWAAVHKAKDVECKEKGLVAVTDVVPPSNVCSAATDGGACEADYRGLGCEADGKGCVSVCTRCG